jgi:hypothetical protein
MKKFPYLFIGVLLVALSLAGCGRIPYMTPIYEEVGPNETAFLVALEGDTKTDQAKMDSLEFYESAKVSAKRIEIPQRWMQMGRKEYEGRWVPTMKLIKVDRSPVTRLWYSEGTKVGDKPGINIETRSSVGVTFGISLSARIDESETAKYLYFYNIRPLAEVMDKEIYATVTSILGAKIGTMQYEEMIARKAEIVAFLQSELTKAYTQYGITIYGIGLYGGIIPDNPAIQASIDAKVIAENERLAAEAQVRTAQVRAQMTQVNSAMADVAYKEALAYYIRMAADKGIKLVPDVQGGTAPLLFNLAGR